MGEFTSPAWVRGLAWTAASIIVGLNLWLNGGEMLGWVEAAAESGRSAGPLRLEWLVGGASLFVFLSALALLTWVTIKPWVWPSHPWQPEEPGHLDWADALRPRPLGTVGVALEHGPADAEIISRALSLAHPGSTRLVLLHVADTPLTGVYGAEAADRHTEADAKYLDDVARALLAKGYEARPILLFGPDRSGQLIAQLRREPVDLLVVGSHGHGLLPDLLFGQTIDRVRHGLDIPMLVARPGADASANGAPGEDLPPAPPGPVG
jgi:manganese transport protein